MGEVRGFAELFFCEAQINFEMLMDKPHLTRPNRGRFALRCALMAGRVWSSEKFWHLKCASDLIDRQSQLWGVYHKDPMAYTGI
jgi:hypothetical protein